jgi:hypothetical protein
LFIDGACFAALHRAASLFLNPRAIGGSCAESQYLLAAIGSDNRTPI